MLLTVIYGFITAFVLTYLSVPPLIFVAKKFNLKEDEIKFYKIVMEKKQLPFFKVEFENSTLNSLTQKLNLK